MESPALYRGHVGLDVIDDQLPSYYLLRPWDIFITPSAEEDIARHEPSLQGMNLRRRMYRPYTSHVQLSNFMIVCAERMLSRLDPLGTLQRKRLFFYLGIVFTNLLF